MLQIISGESGAGKTEATKQVLLYLSDIAQSVGGVEQRVQVSGACSITHRIASHRIASHRIVSHRIVLWRSLINALHRCVETYLSNIAQSVGGVEQRVQVLSAHCLCYCFKSWQYCVW
jgi:hypothetical protein